MKKFNNDQEVLDFIVDSINELQGKLVYSTSQDDNTNALVDAAYRSLEVAKMATFGTYTKNQK